MTEGVRGTLRAREAMMRALRALLEAQRFLEVEMPVLEASAGGADARPFTTFHNALDQPYVLRIATVAILLPCITHRFWVKPLKGRWRGRSRIHHALQRADQPCVLHIVIGARVEAAGRVSYSVVIRCKSAGHASCIGLATCS